MRGGGEGGRWETYNALLANDRGVHVREVGGDLVGRDGGGVVVDLVRHLHTHTATNKEESRLVEPYMQPKTAVTK